MTTTRRTLALLTFSIALLAASCTSDSDGVAIPGGTGDTVTLDTVPAVAPTSEPISSTIPDATPPPTDEPDDSNDLGTTNQADETPAQAPAQTTTTVATVAPTPTQSTPTPSTPNGSGDSDSTFLRRGDEGPTVGILQLKLITLGYLPVGADSGLFDNATNEAVLAFQGQYGVIVDGVVGPETNRALTAAALSVNVESG